LEAQSIQEAETTSAVGEDGSDDDQELESDEWLISTR